MAYAAREGARRERAIPHRARPGDCSELQQKGYVGDRHRWIRGRTKGKSHLLVDHRSNHLRECRSRPPRTAAHPAAPEKPISHRRLLRVGCGAWAVIREGGMLPSDAL